MTSSSVGAALAMFLVTAAATIACSSAEDATEASARSCMPKQELKCLCGLDEGTQVCGANGKPGACKCGKKSSNSSSSSGDDTGRNRDTGTDPGTKTGPDRSKACEDVKSAINSAARTCERNPNDDVSNFINAVGPDCSNGTSALDSSAIGACIKSLEDINASNMTTQCTKPYSDAVESCIHEFNR